ncbi:MAG: hypothetical protein HQK98_09890 [Nitrospirae bacterium]|nr:hypothetical protein [Nitrospirota bacterium]
MNLFMESIAKKISELSERLTLDHGDRIEKAYDSKNESDIGMGRVKISFTFTIEGGKERYTICPEISYNTGSKVKDKGEAILVDLNQPSLFDRTEQLHKDDYVKVAKMTISSATKSVDCTLEDLKEIEKRLAGGMV